MSAPPDRIAALEARVAVTELVARYAAAYARLDVAALVGLYPPDVVLLDGRRGSAALHAHFSHGIEHGPGGGLHTVVLHTGDQVTELLDPDRARGTVYCHVEVLLRDGTGYQQAVRYLDDYRRVGDEWLFARQRTHELCYGAALLNRPNGLPDADWPRSQVGRGTVPHTLDSWRRFWGDPRG